MAEFCIYTSSETQGRIGGSEKKVVRTKFTYKLSFAPHAFARLTASWPASYRLKDIIYRSSLGTSIPSILHLVILISNVFQWFLHNLHLKFPRTSFRISHHELKPCCKFCDQVGLPVTSFPELFPWNLEGKSAGNKVAFPDTFLMSPWIR